MSDRLVLFGTIGVAPACLEWLVDDTPYEMVGVVCSDAPRTGWREATNDGDVAEVAGRRGIPRLGLEDVIDLGCDLGLSVGFHQILRTRHIEAFRLGIVNLHGAPLPEMRGNMCATVALLEGRGEFGASLHWIDEGIDTGDIIDVRRFPLSESDTVQKVFTASNELGLKMIQEDLAQILSGSAPRRVQSAVADDLGVVPRSYRAKDVLEQKRVQLDADPRAMWRAARAFQFPGHEPAFLETPDGRVYLTVGQASDNDAQSEPHVSRAERIGE